MSPKPRVVSGVRPTGRLHLGHLHGVIHNWVELQESYECYFFIADWHALTTEYEDPKIIAQSGRDILADWLAAGINPKKSTLFIQSDVKEHAELYLLLGMTTPLSWLERVPSYKETQQNLANRDLKTYGFLGYPLLQTADVILYNAERVPVGTDQVPHIELSREIVRRINHIYRKAAGGNQLFVEPQPLLTSSPKLLGPDRRKMSKSYDNCIYLADPPEVIRKKIMSAITDPARVRKDDPGDPDICLIYDYHKIHSDKETLERVAQECRAGTMGCVEDKKMMAETLVEFLQPHQQRRQEYLDDPAQLDAILAAGTARARDVAADTMKRVRKVMQVR